MSVATGNLAYPLKLRRLSRVRRTHDMVQLTGVG